MRILVHMCCGPCAITVLQHFKEAGFEVMGLFFNPNIHPLSEYLRRREGAARVAARLDLPVIFADSLPHAGQTWQDPWLAQGRPLALRPGGDALPPAADPAPWLQAVAGREGDRCVFCWRIRLRKTAALAAQLGYPAFSSSLLFSRYQDHEKLRELGNAMAAERNISFAYKDFRDTWRAGVALSKSWGIYRQQYCGCVYSEYDRYARDLRLLTDGPAAGRP